MENPERHFYKCERQGPHLRCSGGLPRTNYSSRKLVLPILNMMSERTRITYSRRAVSRNSEIKKDEQTVIEKEDDTESTLEIERIRGDPSMLQSMTVKELKELTRRMGVAARGNKKDLVSALMESLGEEVIGKEGASTIEQIGPSEVPSKRKSASSVVVEQKLETSEVISATPSKRSRTKQKSIKGTTPEENPVTTVKINKTSHKKETVVANGAIAKAGLGLNVDGAEPWTVLVHKKPQAEWIPYNPKVMRPPPLSKDTRALKILSWNVNGLKALEKDVDVIKESLLEGYTNSFWTCSVSKLGYSGTAIISRVKPLSIKYGLGVPDHDTEGRIVTVEFDDFYLLTAYVPNSGDGLKRLTYRVTEWDPCLGNYMKGWCVVLYICTYQILVIAKNKIKCLVRTLEELEKSKPVILTGDLNCAHQEIDIHDPAGNSRSAGFTKEERKSFETNFLSKGFVDTFRKQHPDVVGYSYWGYRHNCRKTNRVDKFCYMFDHPDEPHLFRHARGKHAHGFNMQPLSVGGYAGWRLDYFLVSESIAERVHDSYILPDVSASDHSPLGLILKL
uniref:Apurinic endonuclease-redox protein n=1 Tax=Aegilops tauschii TaxID=37682 RepID=R7W4A0_AEGTA